jgi:antitoxin VapB
MGALYVKDDEAFQMAKELAVQRGLTKTAAVKLALANELAKSQPEMSLQQRIAEWRRTSPLHADPSVAIDKAFFDSLNDEDSD